MYRSFFLSSLFQYIEILILRASQFRSFCPKNEIGKQEETRFYIMMMIIVIMRNKI